MCINLDETEGGEPVRDEPTMRSEPPNKHPVRNEPPVKNDPPMSGALVVGELVGGKRHFWWYLY